MLTARTRRLRNTAVTLLVIAGCVNYLDRAALAVGNPEIRHALGLSYSQMGLLLSAFAWSYGLAQIPAGIAVDKFGARLALGAGMMLWSVAQIGAGFVTSLAQFITARIALGLGESPMYIGGTRICADYFAAKDRALPIAIFNSSSALAPALAPPLLTLLMIAFGWQAMFIRPGGLCGRHCLGRLLPQPGGCERPGRRPGHHQRRG
jgi:sugar phosphate permease